MKLRIVICRIMHSNICYCTSFFSSVFNVTISGGSRRASPMRIHMCFPIKLRIVISIEVQAMNMCQFQKHRHEQAPGLNSKCVTLINLRIVTYGVVTRSNHGYCTFYVDSYFVCVNFKRIATNRPDANSHVLSQ